MTGKTNSYSQNSNSEPQRAAYALNMRQLMDDSRLAYQEAERCRRHKYFKQAKYLYSKALSLKELALGSKHEQVAIILNNLGLTCYELNDFQDSEGYYLQSLEILEESFDCGELLPNPNLMNCLFNLCRLYQATQLYEKAEICYARLLPLVRKQANQDPTCLGDLASFIKEYANLLNQLGEDKKALKFYLEWVAIITSIYFERHGSTIFGLIVLSLLLLRVVMECQSDPNNSNRSLIETIKYLFAGGIIYKLWLHAMYCKIWPASR